MIHDALLLKSYTIYVEYFSFKATSPPNESLWTETPSESPVNVKKRNYTSENEEKTIWISHNPANPEAPFSTQHPGQL